MSFLSFFSAVAHINCVCVFNCADLLDVYIDDDMKTVHVIDVAPLTEDLNKLVGHPFSWEELQTTPADVPMKIIESSRGIQPTSRNLCGVPVDVRDASSADLNELINAMQRQHFHETHPSAH